jgi:hypothetical protein
MPSQPISSDTWNDLEFEWLLCIASTYQDCLRLRKPEVGKALRPQDLRSRLMSARYMTPGSLPALP